MAKKEVTADDVKTYPLLMREQGSGTLEVVYIALKKWGIKPEEILVEMQLDSTEAIKTYLQYSDCISSISLQAGITVRNSPANLDCFTHQRVAP